MGQRELERVEEGVGEEDSKCSVTHITIALPPRRAHISGLAKAQRLRNTTIFTHVQQANGA